MATQGPEVAADRMPLATGLDLHPLCSHHTGDTGWQTPGGAAAGALVLPHSRLRLSLAD